MLLNIRASVTSIVFPGLYLEPAIAEEGKKEERKEKMGRKGAEGEGWEMKGVGRGGGKEVGLGK
jgi:hypothetical protein